MRPAVLPHGRTEVPGVRRRVRPAQLRHRLHPHLHPRKQQLPAALARQARQPLRRRGLARPVEHQHRPGPRLHRRADELLVPDGRPAGQGRDLLVLPVLSRRGLVPHRRRRDVAVPGRLLPDGDGVRLRTDLGRPLHRADDLGGAGVHGQWPHAVTQTASGGRPRRSRRRSPRTASRPGPAARQLGGHEHRIRRRASIRPRKAASRSTSARRGWRDSVTNGYTQIPGDLPGHAIPQGGRGGGGQPGGLHARARR